MNAKLDRQFSKEKEVGLAILIWVFGASLFASAIVSSYPFEDVSAESFVMFLITVSEVACLSNFLRTRTLRNFITIVQVAGWALAFWLRRKGLIGDLTYAIVTGVFVLSVIYTVKIAMRARHR